MTQPNLCTRTKATKSYSSLCVLTLCSLCLCGSFSSASDQPGPKKLNYQEHVQPILREKCFACHDADKIKGGLDMTTFTKLMEGGGSGPVVTDGPSQWPAGLAGMVA